MGAYRTPDTAHGTSRVAPSSLRRPREAGVSDAAPFHRRRHRSPQAARCHMGLCWRSPQPLPPMESPTPLLEEHLLPSPLRVLAELSLPHVVDCTKAELVGACRHQALDHHRGSLRVHTGQEHGPGCIYEDRGWRRRWASREATLLTPIPAEAQCRLGQQRPSPTRSSRGWSRHFSGSP